MFPNIATFALNVAQSVFLQPWIWFTRLLIGSGLTGIFLASLSLYLAYRFLVAPIFGGAGSDRARNHDKRIK